MCLSDYRCYCEDPKAPQKLIDYFSETFQKSFIRPEYTKTRYKKIYFVIFQKTTPIKENN